MRIKREAAEEARPFEPGDHVAVNVEELAKRHAGIARDMSGKLYLVTWAADAPDRAGWAVAIRNASDLLAGQTVLNASDLTLVRRAGEEPETMHAGL